MILIGTMNITRTRGQGDFHCPTCGASREYKLKSRRPFLTLYFIPTIPIGGLEYFVRCQQCRSHWDPAILHNDGTSPRELQELQFGEEAFRAAVLLAVEDRDVSEEQIELLIRISNRLLLEPADREDLGRLVSSAHQNRITAANYVRSVCPGWTTDQRQFALQAMFVAVTGQGELDESKLQLLASLRDTMDLTDQEYQEAIEAAIQWDVETAAD
jgi:predicted RNA-binding Zn-ribbon protein involved in translation (DUF1610 family)